MSDAFVSLVGKTTNLIQITTGLQQSPSHQQQQDNQQEQDMGMGMDTSMSLLDDEVKSYPHQVL